MTIYTIIVATAVGKILKRFGRQKKYRRDEKKKRDVIEPMI